MVQTQASGAAANAWGHSTARAIAKQLGARLLRSGSNECELRGERIVLKCARQKTASVGVTFKMLERLDAVIGAFQVEDGSFELWRLTRDEYEHHMRPTASRGASAGKVGIVAKSTFRAEGRRAGKIHRQESR